MYDLYVHGKMLSSTARSHRFLDALRAVIHPGDVVADIGTGIGVFAVAACHLGASRVYAVEPANAIAYGPALARANGCADRIEFIQDISTRVELPERVDVVISDLRGTLPYFQHHIPSIVDARERLMKPGGTLVGLQDDMWGAPVEVPERYAELTSIWERPFDGIDMSSIRARAVQTWQRVVIEEREVIGTPSHAATLDYATIDDPEVPCVIRSPITRSGTVHGIGLWFDATLAPGVCFSGAPGQPSLIYKHAFFPLAVPVQVSRGDVFHARLTPLLSGQDYLWTWQTSVTGLDGVERARAFNSTISNALPSPDALRRSLPTFVPTLSDAGILDRDILAAFDGHTTLREVAERIAGLHARQFPTWKDAMPVVTQMSRERCREVLPGSSGKSA